jgi:hypothetical protein
VIVIDLQGVGARVTDRTEGSLGGGHLVTIAGGDPVPVPQPLGLDVPTSGIRALSLEDAVTIGLVVLALLLCPAIAADSAADCEGGARQQLAACAAAVRLIGHSRSRR